MFLLTAAKTPREIPCLVTLVIRDYKKAIIIRCLFVDDPTITLYHSSRKIRHVLQL